MCVKTINHLKTPHHTKARQSLYQHRKEPTKPPQQHTNIKHPTTTIVTHPKSSLKHPNRSPAHHFHPPSHYIYISTATIPKRKLVLSIATGLREIFRAYMYLSTLVQSHTQLFKRRLDSGSRNAWQFWIYIHTRALRCLSWSFCWIQRMRVI